MSPNETITTIYGKPVGSTIDDYQQFLPHGEPVPFCLGRTHIDIDDRIYWLDCDKIVLRSDDTVLLAKIDDAKVLVTSLQTLIDVEVIKPCEAGHGRA